MPGFCGRADSKILTRLFRLALSKGGCVAGNRRITYQGDYSSVATFAGNFIVEGGAKGCFTFQYFAHHIFILDLDDERVTDLGMRDYSQSTAATLYGIHDALGDIFKWPALRRALDSYYGWTRDLKRRSPHLRKGRALRPAGSYNYFYPKKFDYDALYDRFRKGVPWLRRDTNGVWWFYWRQFNPADADLFRDSVDDLREDRRYMYYTFKWMNGMWSRVFIDEDAERRWNNRQRQRHYVPVNQKAA